MAKTKDTETEIKVNSAKIEALNRTLAQIEKQFGKGSIMRL
jgi:RecA/RadA recombinase